MRATEGHARNTLGFCLAMIGEVEPGAEQLREAIRIARERDHLPDLSDAYNNYSDMLHVVGRTTEALEAVAEGLQAVDGRRPVAMMWLHCQRAEFEFDIGEWELSEASLPAPQRWTGTQTRVNLGLRRASLVVGRGEHEAARAILDELEEMAAASSEPQFIGPYAVLTAEQHRREGDLDGARAAIERGLDRMEFCTDDAARVAAVAAAGVTVEADAAERARDLGEAEAESAALQRLDDLLARVAAAATPHTPGRVRAAAGGARRGGPRRRPPRPGRLRARCGGVGRARAPGAGRPDAPARGRGVRRRGRPRRGRAVARPRPRCRGPARRRLARGARSRAWPPAAACRSRAPPRRRRPSRRPTRTRSGSLHASARCSRCVAEGATNREIGAALYMAEKTASVHVSRILGKLNVRSRTEAAAVAHRHGLSS